MWTYLVMFRLHIVCGVFWFHRFIPKSFHALIFRSMVALHFFGNKIQIVSFISRLIKNKIWWTLKTKLLLFSWFYGSTFIVSRIMCSTWINHRSTLPLAAFGLVMRVNTTFSLSTLYMAVMSRFSWNSNALMPSKHFFKNGCTRRGSFVSDKISNNSSLDKKKNRGNANRFVSR